MSGPISIESAGQWQKLLSDTRVVVADFYADWCGPCKMIAPEFERLARAHGRPGKMAFAKVNVDKQAAVARANSVAAMPTFKIFHNGACIDTVKGANPPALAEAVRAALRLADAPGAAFKTPGCTLGGEGAPSAPAARRIGSGWSLNGLVNALIVFVGLYLVSLFSFDARKAAEASWFNIHKAPADNKTGRPGAGPARPAQKPAFRTLADLGSE